jgi:hypothetical protein
MRTVAFVILALAPVLAFGQSFNPPCELPFADIAKRRPFDSQCGIEGDAVSDKKLLQNRVKNNFCADGDPIFTTFTTYLEMQKLAKKHDVLGPGYGAPPSGKKAG